MKTSKKPKNITKTFGKGKLIHPTVSYDTFLGKQLADLDFATGYLQSCLDEGEDIFLQGIRNVAKAHGGMKALSDSTQLNRESLYSMLSENGNPLFSSINLVLKELGIGLAFKVR